MLAASGLPDHIVDGFLQSVDGSSVKARLGSNLLVYWASAHYDDRTEVFKCASIIRALGYTELADKLESDRTVATVRYPVAPDDKLEVYIPDSINLERDMKGIPGAQLLTAPDGNLKKQGRKIGWSVPLAEALHFETVLGVHCGKELACGTKGIYPIPKKNWADVKAFRQPSPQQTFAASVQGGTVQVLTLANGRMEIHSPFNPAFKEALKTQVPYRDRIWTGTCWSVASRYHGIIKSLIQMHYGVMV